VVRKRRTAEGNAARRGKLRAAARRAARLATPSIVMPARFFERALRAVCAAIAFASLAAAASAAEEYPSRPIKIVVPTAPAGAGDAIARRIAERLGAELRTPVVVENRPGASGVIGNELAARSPADGHTLLFATSATHVIAAYTTERLPYDPQRDFAPVINVAWATSVVVVSSALPVKTLAELVAYARARPGQVHYASSGVGSANHVDTEAFAAVAGLSLVHVPYRGTSDGYRALVADEVQMMFGAVTSALPYVRSGKVRALAVLTERRSPVLPEVPTLAEAGLRDVDVRKWLGLLAPAGTPPGIVARLNRTLDGILREPEMRAWMSRQGLEVAGGTVEDFDHQLQADFVKWGATVRKLGLRPE